MVNETRDVAAATLAALDRQGQQLERAAHGVEQASAQAGAQQAGVCALAPRVLAIQRKSCFPKSWFTACLPPQHPLPSPLQIDENVQHAGRILAFMSRFCCFRNSWNDPDLEREARHGEEMGRCGGLVAVVLEG